MLKNTGEELHAVIFDMDGLMVDTEPYWDKVQIEVFGSYGINLTLDDTLQTKGSGIHRICLMRLNGDKQKAAEAGDKILAAMLEMVKQELVPKDGLMQTLAFFEKQGVKIGLASSSPRPLIMAVVEKLEIKAKFQVIVSGAEMEHAKPHPMVYLEAARQLGVAPKNCLTFEDSLNGTLSAKSALMCCVSVPEEFPNHSPKFAIADTLLKSLRDVDEKLVTSLFVAQGA
eukprot:Selendium_serpulae@DN6272_c0_g1_i2.p1